MVCSAKVCMALVPWRMLMCVRVCVTHRMSYSCGRWRPTLRQCSHRHAVSQCYRYTHTHTHTHTHSPAIPLGSFMHCWLVPVYECACVCVSSQAQAHLLKIRHESGRNRTRERALLHMEQLVEVLRGTGAQDTNTQQWGHTGTCVCVCVCACVCACVCVCGMLLRDPDCALYGMCVCVYQSASACMSLCVCVYSLHPRGRISMARGSTSVPLRIL